jgi:hypothetical protein
MLSANRCSMTSLFPLSARLLRRLRLADALDVRICTELAGISAQEPSCTTCTKDMTVASRIVMGLQDLGVLNPSSEMRNVA